MRGHGREGFDFSYASGNQNWFPLDLSNRQDTADDGFALRDFYTTKHIFHIYMCDYAID